MNSQIHYWAGLIAAICVALIGQAEQIPEPWRHWVSVIGIVATAIYGYKIQPQPPADEKRQAIIKAFKLRKESKLQEKE